MKKIVDPITIFTHKAKKYARYRWDYAPEAIRFIIEKAGINSVSAVADIGAGTGVLTREFIGGVGMIYAIEPNPEMRAFAEKEFSGIAGCHVLDGRAESIPLPDDTIDLVTAAQAVHWFEPHAARREFQRILKHRGWLAILRNYGVDQDLGEALQDIFPAECDTEASMVGKREPREFYYQRGEYQKKTYPIASKLSWDAFLGALSTTSYAPDEGTSAYNQFETLARDVFSRFRKGDVVEMNGVTEVYLGQI